METAYWKARAEHAERMLALRDQQLKLSGDKWQEAAEEALAGDPRGLRNRVEMRKLGPVEIVQSRTIPVAYEVGGPDLEVTAIAPQSA